MTYHMFLSVMMFGIVGAGIVHSCWLWLGRTPPAFSSLLLDTSPVAAVFKVLAIMFAAPLILAGSSTRMVNYGWRYAGLSVIGLIVSAMWCFMTGIVILFSLDMLMAG